MPRLLWSICAISFALGGTAAAQTFTYANKDDVKDVKAVDWSATAEAGLLVTTGNAKTTTVTAAAKAQRLDPKNKIAAELGLAYARSTILVANDADMSGTISAGEIDEQSSTTANSWHAQVRYDRFLTGLDSLYAAALASADKPSGKQLVGGGQLGYSRHLRKTETQEAVAEIGYDFSYEKPVSADGVAIHSLRAFLGIKQQIKKTSELDASVEVLSNLNKLDTQPTEAKMFEDTRIDSNLALSSKITKDISLSVSFEAKFDNHPSPRPPFGIPYEAGFVPVAEKVDTITKASLIITLL
jgi:putative salt-induced outer membrane protein YdiY